jgi:hypothetical protein
VCVELELLDFRCQMIGLAKVTAGTIHSCALHLEDPDTEDGLTTDRQILYFLTEFVWQSSASGEVSIYRAVPIIKTNQQHLPIPTSDHFQDPRSYLFYRSTLLLLCPSRRIALERPGETTSLGMILFSLFLFAEAMQAANAGSDEAESVLAKMESIARGVRDDLEIAHSARCDPVILTECASQNYNDCSSKFPQPQCGLEFDEKSPPSECSCGSECDRIYSSCARILLLTLNQAFAPVFAQRISIVGHVDFDHRYAVIPFRGKRHSERRRSS